MTTRYHITRRPEGSWQLQREGTIEPAAVCGSVATAINMALSHANGREDCRVVVHAADGSVREERQLAR